MKLLLIDLDGTVREPKSGAKFINKPDDQKLIQGVEDAITRYQDWTIVGITNQGGVKAGFKSLESTIQEQQITLKLLPQLSYILFCPDDGQTCWHVLPTGVFEASAKFNPELKGTYRKPGAGMLLSVMGDFKDDRWETIVPEEVLYVGDREEDRLAAQAAGVEFMWADQWRSSAAMFSRN